MGRLAPGWAPPDARRQLGLFTVRQAWAAGATPDQVRRRITSGEWVRVRGDAFAASGTAPTPERRMVSIGLTWPDAVACLGTAARFHGLPVPDDVVDHALVPRRRASRHSIATHRYPLGRGDVESVDGALVTGRTRTLLDCVGRLPQADAERLVSWAATRQLLSAGVLERALRDGPWRWGNTQRRQALEDVRAGALSAAERRLHRLLDRHGLTGWRADHPIRDASGIIGRADVAFVAERLVIEVDGFRYHAVTEFQADRDKQNRLIAAGWSVLRFTWHDVVDRPQHVVAQIAALLATRRPG
ncbi:MULTISPECIES: type IV toxin-antitoxin system AbiEi family antitoxin domain-containing protein [unclassified Actinotalea]|uniref:type IV toxin-antitoxin system AbiEi family antitoxin domain-containing protein n=1 Tax=unclassified Actinotalea TaxID=2638618 RepID=UPI0015F663E0|nr:MULTISPECIES: type IV toxin-antitoxin system AbiEi family antitoxin domain-containing protein [unclassified Actinotalea]